MGRVRTAFMIGLATGAIGVLLSLVPAVSSLDVTLGLRALFRLRGPLPAPPGVAVVSIDESAAARLNLPRAVGDWPRSYHARVIDQLVAQGATVIAFDLQFFRDGPAADDEELADAIARSKRIVLVQRLERLPGSGHEIWRRQDPIPAFADVAAGLAPGPIPDTPLISWFWTFVTAAHGEEVPTLPTVVLQVTGRRAAKPFGDALTVTGFYEPAPQGPPGELLAYMREMRRRFKGDSPTLARALTRLGLIQRFDRRERQLARRLVRLYAGNAASYLNFYGPPGSVCTVPYEVVYEGGTSPCPLKDATVFVGVGRSAFDRAGQIDTYHTVYERADGVDLSGVELQATAFANLIGGTALQALGPVASAVTLLGVGLLFGASIYWGRTQLRYVRGGVSARLEAAAFGALLVGLYCLITYALFALFHVIAPVVVPLAVQLPTALVLGLLAQPKELGASTAEDTSR